MRLAADLGADGGALVWVNRAGLVMPLSIAREPELEATAGTTRGLLLTGAPNTLWLVAPIRAAGT